MNSIGDQQRSRIMCQTEGNTDLGLEPSSHNEVVKRKQNIRGKGGVAGKDVGDGAAKQRVSLDLEGGEGEGVEGRGGVSGAARERVSRMERERAVEVWVAVSM